MKSDLFTFFLLSTKCMDRVHFSSQFIVGKMVFSDIPNVFVFTFPSLTGKIVLKNNKYGDIFL